MISPARYRERPLTREQARARALFPRGLSQPPGAYRFGLEALLLACLPKPPPGALALDMGTGCGAAGLALALRCQGIGVVGFERLPELCRAAAANALRLGLRPDRLSGPAHLPGHLPDLSRPLELPSELLPALSPEQGNNKDLQSALKIHASSRPESFFSALCGDLAAPPLAEGLFDLALANPPFRRGNRGRLPKDRLRRAALFEDGDSLGCFCRAASFCLKAGGRLSIIYDADRADELLTALERQGLILLRLKPVVTRKGRPPLRLLAEALRPAREGPEGPEGAGPGRESESGAGAASGPDRKKDPKPGHAGVGPCPPPIMEEALVLHQDGEKTFSAEALAFCSFLQGHDAVNQR